MLTVSEQALDKLKQLVHDKTGSQAISDHEFTTMVSICRSFTNENIWELELMYLPRSMPTNSIVDIHGLTFHHPGDINDLDAQITLSQGQLLVNHEKAIFT